MNVYLHEVVILTFEEETLKYDEKNKECTGYLGKYHESLSINFMINTEHMEEYKNLGHPYICDYSLNPSLTWVLAMSPQMANILNNSEYIEVDATFKGSIELEYLFNVDYNSLHCKSIFSTSLTGNYVGVVVARVRLNKLNADAYRQAVFNQVKKYYIGFEVGKTLNGIITDWSDTQLNGLELAIGKETTNLVTKGCQVLIQLKCHFMIQHHIGTLPTVCQKSS